MSAFTIELGQLESVEGLVGMRRRDILGAAGSAMCSIPAANGKQAALVGVDKRSKPMITITSETTYEELKADLAPGERRTINLLDDEFVSEGRFSSIIAIDDGPLESWLWINEPPEGLFGSGYGLKQLSQYDRPLFHVGPERDEAHIINRHFFGRIVSKKMLAVLLDFDPGVIEYLPVHVILAATGEPAPGEWFMFDAVRVTQVVDFSRFRGELEIRYGHMGTPEFRGAVFRQRNLPSDWHLVRDKLQSTTLLYSAELLEALKAAGVNDFDEMLYTSV